MEVVLFIILLCVLATVIVVLAKKLEYERNEKKKWQHIAVELYNASGQNIKDYEPIQHK